MSVGDKRTAVIFFRAQDGQTEKTWTSMVVAPYDNAGKKEEMGSRFPRLRRWDAPNVAKFPGTLSCLAPFLKIDQPEFDRPRW